MSEIETIQSSSWLTEAQIYRDLRDRIESVEVITRSGDFEHRKVFRLRPPTKAESIKEETVRGRM